MIIMIYMRPVVTTLLIFNSFFNVFDYRATGSKRKHGIGV